MSWLLSWLRGSLTSATHRFVLATAAELDPDGVVRSWPNRSDWVGLPLVRAIESLSLVHELHVDIISDGAAGALGEARAHEISNLVYLGLGTGVATGWVAEGAPIPQRIPINLAHVEVISDGSPCVCGKTGCLQAWASARGIQNRLTALGRPKISWAEIVQDWRSDGFEPVRTRTTAALAKGAELALSIFGCGTVVIGGRAADVLPGLVEDVSSTLGGSGATIRKGLLGANAALCGAAELAELRWGAL